MSNLLLVDSQHGVIAQKFENCENKSSSEPSSIVRKWSARASSTENANSDSPRKSSSNDQLENAHRRSLRIATNQEINSKLPLSLNPNRDPEYLPPKRILKALKKSGDDLVPQSEIIVNVKRRKLRTRKFSNLACDCRAKDAGPSVNCKGEQLFADLDMNTPISTEQLRQILEDSASEESSRKANLEAMHQDDWINARTEENDCKVENAKMNCTKPSLKIRLRKLNKKTAISPSRSKRQSNSDTDSSSQMCNVPKDDIVLPKAHLQKELGKVLRRKRQTCRKQFRHKDITLYKLGAGQEKVSVPKNQVIHKIFARRSSVNTPSPSSARYETDIPKKDVSEKSLLLEDPTRGSWSNKCPENFTVNNNVSISAKDESSSNIELEHPNKVKLSSIATETTPNKLDKVSIQTNLNCEQKYKIASKGNSDIIPQLQIREETSSGLMSPAKGATGHQMANRNEIGKHNLPIRIPERRTSIAEPLRTPPVLNKVPSFRTEKPTENRSNYLKIEVKSGTSEKPEVIYLKSASAQDKTFEITKLKETQLTSTPFVKLCRLPDSQTFTNKLIHHEVTTDNGDKKNSGVIEKDLGEIKLAEKDELDNQPKTNDPQISTNSEQIETNKELPQEYYNTSPSCSPQNLSIKVVKSCSGITDPLKVHRPLHSQNKKNDLGLKNRSNNIIPPKEGYYNNYQRSENQDASQSNSPGLKTAADMSEVNYKKSSILQQNLLLRPGYKMDPYRSAPVRRNSNSINNSAQERSAYITNPSTGNPEILHNATHNLPRNMPIIEDANQQPFSNKTVSDALVSTPNESGKKYKRGKRKSTTEGFEDTAAKLYRGSTYQPYNNYNYPLHLYAGAHPNSPYGSLPPFSIGVPPPPYSMCPPVYQPRQPRQPSTCNVRCETTPAFPDTGGRPIIQPFLSQDTRLPMQPYPLANIPTSEAYTRMNYEHLMRFNNSVFANCNTLHHDYVAAAASSNRRNEALIQNSSPTVQPGTFDLPSTNFSRNGIRPNLYQQFTVPAAHQQSTKVTDTQSTPLALIKNVTTSQCNERSIPIISKNEELTITKLPLREGPANSSHTSVLKAHDIVNIIPSSNKAEFQKTDKSKLELHNGNAASLVKVSRNNTEVIGPLRYSPNKNEITNRPPCDMFEHSSPGKFTHSELASISVSIVKSSEKQYSSEQTKHVTDSHTSVLPLSEQIKLLNTERLNLASQKSESPKFISETNTNNNNVSYSVATQAASHTPSCEQQATTLQPLKTDISNSKTIMQERIRSSYPSPYTISDTSITDAERESEIEEGPSVITIITDEREHNSHEKTEKSDKLADISQPSEDTPPENKPEPVTSQTFSQLNDELISGILAQPTTRNEFIKSLHALTFIVNNMLYNSDRISEDEKTKLRHMLEGPIKNFNTVKPDSPSLPVSSSVVTLKEVKFAETVATTENIMEVENSKPSPTIEDESNATIKLTNDKLNRCESSPTEELETNVAKSNIKVPIQNSDNICIEKPLESSAEASDITQDKDINQTCTSSLSSAPDKNSIFKEDKESEAKFLNIALQRGEMLNFEEKQLQIDSNQHKSEEISAETNTENPCQPSSEFEKITLKEEILSSSKCKTPNDVVENSVVSPSCSTQIKKNLEVSNVEILPSSSIPLSLEDTHNSLSKEEQDNNIIQLSSDIEKSNLNKTESDLNLTTTIAATDENDNNTLNYLITDSSQAHNGQQSNDIQQPPNTTISAKNEEKQSELRQFRIFSASQSRKFDSEVQSNSSSYMQESVRNSVLNLSVDASTNEKNCQVRSCIVNNGIVEAEMPYISSPTPSVASPSLASKCDSEDSSASHDRTTPPSYDVENCNINEDSTAYISVAKAADDKNNTSPSCTIIQHSANRENTKEEMDRPYSSQSSCISSPLWNTKYDSGTDNFSRTQQSIVAQDNDSSIQENLSSDLTPQSSVSKETNHNQPSLCNSTALYENEDTKTEVEKCRLSRSTDTSPSPQDIEQHGCLQPNSSIRSHGIENSSCGEGVSPSNVVLHLHKLEKPKAKTECQTSRTLCVSSPIQNVERLNFKVDDSRITKSEHIEDNSNIDKKVVISKSKLLPNTEESDVIKISHTANNSQIKINNIEPSWRSPSTQNQYNSIVYPKAIHSHVTQHTVDSRPSYDAENISHKSSSYCNSKALNSMPETSESLKTSVIFTPSNVQSCSPKVKDSDVIQDTVLISDGENDHISNNNFSDPNITLGTTKTVKVVQLHQPGNTDKTSFESHITKIPQLTKAAHILAPTKRKSFSSEIEDFSMPQNGSSQDIDSTDLSRNATSENYRRKAEIQQLNSCKVTHRLDAMEKSKEIERKRQLAQSPGSPLQSFEYYSPKRDSPMSQLYHVATVSKAAKHSAADTSVTDSNVIASTGTSQFNNVIQPLHNLENPKVNSLNPPYPSYMPTSASSYISGNSYIQQSFFNAQPVQKGNKNEFAKNASSPNVSYPKMFPYNDPLPQKRPDRDSIINHNSRRNSNSTYAAQQSPPAKKCLHQTSTSPSTCYKYANKEVHQNVERNNSVATTEFALNKDGEVLITGEKRMYTIDETHCSRTTKRKRVFSDEKTEALPRSNYNEQLLYQPQIPPQPENVPFGMYPSYPPGNMEYGRSIRSHLVNESQLSSDGIVNYSKQPVLPSKLHEKRSNLDQAVEVPTRGLDIRNTSAPMRQPVIYNAGEAVNRTNYHVKDNFSTVPSFRQNTVREGEFTSNSNRGNFGDVQSSHSSLNTRILADLKEKCLRGSRSFQIGSSRSPDVTFSNAAQNKITKENSSHLRINANVPNFSNNISPDYGYFSPLSKNAPTHFEPSGHRHSNSTHYSDASSSQNLQYRRMSNSSQHSATDSLENYRVPSNTCGTATTTNTSSNVYVKHNAKMPSNTLPKPMPNMTQSKAYQQDPPMMFQNINMQDKISSILPKLQQSGTLTPEQYVSEMNMLEKDGCPRPFLEFYSYVTKKQISSNQMPIGFRIFLEFQNAGKLKTFEKAFKIYSEKHEKEKRMTPKSN